MYKVRYADLKIYMQTRYVNGEDRWSKTLLDAMDVLVNWKGGKRPPKKNYEFSEGIALKTKFNPSGFRGDCYNCGNSRHISRDCPEPRKYEGRNSNQAEEDAHIQLN